MFRIFLVACLAVFASSALAGIEGDWFCAGKAVTTTYSGLKPIRETVDTVIITTFLANGKYVSQSPRWAFPVKGRYQVESRRLKMHPKKKDVAAVAEYGCASMGLACKAFKVSNLYKGILNRNKDGMILKSTISLAIRFPKLKGIILSKGKTTATCTHL